MNSLKRLIDFLDKLRESKIYYKLDNVRDGIMVEISVPGERWEVEFMENGTIEIERFISEGAVFDEKELDRLFRDFSD